MSRPKRDPIQIACDTLSELVLQKKYAHMREPVQMILGGLLLPILVDRGALDTSDPDISFFLNRYSKDNINKMLNPEPIEVPLEIPIEVIIRERPKFRRIREKVKKVKRKRRPLTPQARDAIIKWWNENQKLVPSDIPICVIITEKINKEENLEYPLSNMQTSGYFSLLCSMGKVSEEERIKFFNETIEYGLHTLMPVYTPEFMEVIEENRRRMKIEKSARMKDHYRIRQLRKDGEYKPVIAEVPEVPEGEI
jgi:hypothetical protein